MGLELRLQRLEISAPKNNSASELSDEELEIEANRVKTKLKRALQSADLTDDEATEIRRILGK